MSGPGVPAIDTEVQVVDRVRLDDVEDLDGDDVGVGVNGSCGKGLEFEVELSVDVAEGGNAAGDPDAGGFSGLVHRVWESLQLFATEEDLLIGIGLYEGEDSETELGGDVEEGWWFFGRHLAGVGLMAVVILVMVVMVMNVWKSLWVAEEV